MLTVQAVRFGAPQVLAARQAPDPVAGPGQAVVRASAADVRIRPGHRAGVPADRRGRRARRPGVQDRRRQDAAAPLTPGRPRESTVAPLEFGATHAHLLSLNLSV